MTMASSLMRASVPLHSLSSNAWISNPKHFRSDEQISAKRLLPTSIHPVVSMDNVDSKLETVTSSRRELTLAALMSTLIAANNISMARDAQAVSTSRRALRSEQIPIENYTTLPNGLKYYDVKVGSGPIAVTGSRVAVHYVAKWKGVTFQTSRQGLGVTGGTPYGFDVGASKYGIVLKGLDLGVEGMRVGGQRLLILPPELAYGDRGVQEIPPKATIEFNVELLSIKQTPFGSSVKVVEG